MRYRMDDSARLRKSGRLEWLTEAHETDSPLPRVRGDSISDSNDAKNLSSATSYRLFGSRYTYGSYADSQRIGEARMGVPGRRLIEYLLSDCCQDDKYF